MKLKVIYSSTVFQMPVLLLPVLLLGCNNANLGIKEVGESIGKAADTVVEGVKQTPKAIGDAAHNLDKKVNE